MPAPSGKAWSRRPIKPQAGTHRTARALLAESRAASRRGDLEHAAYSLRRLTELCPQEARAHAELANLLVRLNDLSGARAAYARAQALSPRDPLLCERLGSLNQRLGDVDLAVRWFQRGLGLAPENGRLCWRLGQLYASLDQHMLAVRWYCLALRRETDHPDSLYALAGECRRMGLVAEASALYSRLVQILPEHALAWTALGELAEAAGSPEAAAVCWEQALAAGEDANLMLRLIALYPAIGRATDTLSASLAALEQATRQSG